MRSVHREIVYASFFIFINNAKKKIILKISAKNINIYTPDNSSVHMMMMADNNTTFSALNVPTPCRTCSTAINAIFWSFGVTNETISFFRFEWSKTRKTNEKENSRITVGVYACVCKHQARCAYTYKNEDDTPLRFYRRIFVDIIQNCIIHSSKFSRKVF